MMFLRELKAACLEYFVGTTHVFCLLIDGDGRSEKFCLARVDEMYPLIESFTTSLKNATVYSGARAKGMESFSLEWGKRLLPPFEALEPFDILVIIPHYWLHRIPFQIIWIGERRQFLGVIFGLVYNASAALFRHCMNRNTVRASELLKWQFAMDDEERVNAPPPPKRCAGIGIDVVGSLTTEYQELALRLLPPAAVGEYLVGRFPASDLPATLAAVLHQRTEGNPLFMVSVVAEWIAQGAIVPGGGRWALQRGVEEVAGGVPQSLRQLMEQQLGRLSPEEQRVLETASVAGAEFSAAAMAAGVELEVGTVEQHCEGLARRSPFLRASGLSAWPDGTVAARYGFLHTLYQELMYERVPAGRRVRLHQRIGVREAAAYGERAGEIAAELAMHFERGREYGRAVQYRQTAGESALRRSAYVEAVSHLTRGLELLPTLPDTPDRIQQELKLQITLGPTLTATKGYAAPEVGRAYTRARVLCQQVGETPLLFPALWGLWIFYSNRAELRIARELGEQLLRWHCQLAKPPHRVSKLRHGHIARSHNI